MSPPITMTAGLRMLTQAASTPPISRPAWRTSRTASCWPASTWCTTSRLERVGRPELVQPAGEGAAAGDGLEAADVPAAAHHVVVVADVDVADVAGRAVGPAVHVPAGDDARPDAGADLDEQQERLVAPVHPVLADGHDVHVVVDQRRHAEVLRQPLAHRVVVPARHDRRVHGPAGDVLDRARQADADAAERAEVAAGLAQQLLDRRLEPGQQRVGSLGDRDLPGPLDEDVAPEVGDRDAGVGGPDVGPRDDAGLAVEGERGGRSAAGRRAVGARAPASRLARRTSTRWAMVERASPVAAARSPRVTAWPCRTRSRIVPAEPPVGGGGSLRSTLHGHAGQ